MSVSYTERLAFDYERARLDGDMHYCTGFAVSGLDPLTTEMNEGTELLCRVMRFDKSRNLGWQCFIPLIDRKKRPIKHHLSTMRRVSDAKKLDWDSFGRFNRYCNYSGMRRQVLRK